MKQTFYGYDIYRGRSRLQTALTVLILILLVLLILAVAAFFLLQPYISYDDQGKAHLDLPFFTQSDPTPTPAAVETANIVMVATPEPTPEPTPQPGPVVAVLPISILTEDTGAYAVNGATALLFDMKAPSGDLAYVSELKWAVRTKVSASDPHLNETLLALNGGEVYTVARLSCFKDDTVPYYYGPDAGFRVGGGNWRDGSGSRWLSPATGPAQDYVAGIIAELAGLGFDEILLDYATFPTTGRMNSVVTGEAYQDDPDFKAQALDTFYAKVRETLADYPDVKLSLVVESGFLTGDPADPSGLTAELVAEYFDLLYLPVPQEGQDFSTVLEAIGLPENRLVYLGADGPQGSSGYLLEPGE